jgi:hypothetical protein
MALPLQKALRSVGRFVVSNPLSVLKVARHAASLRLAVPLDAIRWFVENTPPSKKSPTDVSITAQPPAIHLGATIELMGSKLRASAAVAVEELRIDEDEMRLTLRMSRVEMRVLDKSETPIAGLIKSGALDLTKSGNLAAHLPGLSRLLGESTGNRLVIDLMKHPALGKSRVARRVLGLVSSVVTVHGVESDEGHLDVLLRAFPNGMRGAGRAVRDHLFTDGPPWIRGMLPGGRSNGGEPRRGY